MSVLGMPDNGSRIVAAADDWTPMADSPGWSERTLLETPRFTTQLMRVEPGVISEPHAHDRIEQVYILSGSLTDADGTEHGPGTYIVRAAGTLHGGSSREGATLLVIYGDVG